MITVDSNAALVENIRARRDGAPLLLLLPGLSGSREQWSIVLRHLDIPADLAYGAPLRAHAVFGGALPSVAELGRALATELRDSDYDNVVIVTHSVGAFVALTVAREIPELVRSAVLINGGLAGVAAFLDRPFREFLRRPGPCLSALRLFVLVSAPTPPAVRRMIAGRPRLARLLLGGLVSDSAFDTLEQRQALLEESGGPRLLLSLWKNRHHWRELKGYADPITTPITFLIGDRDPVSGVADTATMARMLPTSSVRVLHGIGHAAPIEAPGAVVEAIRQALTDGPTPVTGETFQPADGRWSPTTIPTQGTG